MATKTTKENPKEAEQRKVKLVGVPSQVEDVFADGLSGVIGRGGVIKFEFYRFLGVDQKEDAEVRQIVQRLVLPAAAVQELAAAIKGIIDAEQKKQSAKN